MTGPDLLAAIAQRASFNVIHLGTMVKVDELHVIDLLRRALDEVGQT